MAIPPLDGIQEYLAGMGGRGSFAARRTAAADALRFEVTGVGPIDLPISRTRAQQLLGVARPARYGRGEETVLDARVRDTWEIPKSRVKIDRRRWNRTLLPMLDRLRADLGLPEGRTLQAELHNALIYTPGQFFLPHQDSEKTDDMIGTLVVTLPSAFEGGAFIVTHGGETVTYRASKQALTFVAFYADCRHEVRPVTEGYRLVLTYNLLLKAAVVDSASDTAAAGALADRLRRYFDATLPSQRAKLPMPRSGAGAGAPEPEPPNRLVCMLDHQYTERGLAWDRLKGDDAARVAVLRAAAERAGCEITLALADVHETWGCEDDGFDRYERWGGYRNRYDDMDDFDDDDLAPDGPDGHTLTELHDRDTTLQWWIPPDGMQLEPIHSMVSDAEVVSTMPASALEPYASEHEGYMGNYGNTVDRWYRRAAVVLWPRERAFNVRAEISPAWAIREVGRLIQAGSPDEARERTESMLPLWRSSAGRQQGDRLFMDAIVAAAGLDAPELAASVLTPFRLAALTAREAPAFALAAGRYGAAWTRSLLAAWAATDRIGWGGASGDERYDWSASLPALCAALDAGAAARAAGAAELPVARMVLEDQLRWLRSSIVQARGFARPSARAAALLRFATPVHAFLEAAATRAADLHTEMIAFLLAGENEALLPCLVELLRAADRAEAPAERAASGLDALRQHCIRLLEARLAAAPRAGDDWSLTTPDFACQCALCDTLAAFLAAPDRPLLEWPLAEQGRKHVHQMVERHELPVRHETRRTGRPYTLVLTKAEALFEQEAAERLAWRADLEWLTGRAKR